MLCIVTEELISEVEARPELVPIAIELFWSMTVVIIVGPEAPMDVMTVLEVCVTVVGFGADGNVDVVIVKMLAELEVVVLSLVPSSTV